MALIEKCTCGNNTDFSQDVIQKIPVNVCKVCGTIHQSLNISSDEYYDFYRREYHSTHQEGIGCLTYDVRYDHDKEVAALRHKEYKPFLNDGAYILDIGSSNNAFVDYMEEQGYLAFGQELNDSFAKHNTYTGDLHDIHFPPCYFDMITVHDVFEHFIDPVHYLKEMIRILKHDGTLVIDYPNYFDDAGKHHWRPIQHLWYQTKDQLVALLEEHGMSVVDIRQPLASKLVLYIQKKEHPVRKKILVLPGMGDIYWVMTKMQSFIEKEGIDIPEIWIWNFDNRPRSEDYVRRIPFVEFGGYWDHPVVEPEFSDSYHYNTWLVENFEGFDYYISMNGVLVMGDKISNSYGLDKYETDWYFPFFTPKSEEAAGRKFKEKYDRYIVAYFSELGMFGAWVKHFKPVRCWAMLKKIAEQLDAKVILTGCEWDRPFNDEIKAFDKDDRFIDMIGETSIDEFYGLIKNSLGVIGWCGGNTIKTTSFHVPTVMFWSKLRFPEQKFYTNCVPPNCVNKWYIPLTVEDFAGTKNDLIIRTALHLFNRVDDQEETNKLLSDLRFHKKMLVERNKYMARDCEKVAARVAGENQKRRDAYKKSLETKIKTT